MVGSIKPSPAHPSRDSQVWDQPEGSRQEWQKDCREYKRSRPTQGEKRQTKTEIFSRERQGGEHAELEIQELHLRKHTTLWKKAEWEAQSTSLSLPFNRKLPNQSGMTTMGRLSSYGASLTKLPIIKSRLSDKAGSYEHQGSQSDVAETGGAWLW